MLATSAGRRKRQGDKPGLGNDHHLPRLRRLPRLELEPRWQPANPCQQVPPLRSGWAVVPRALRGHTEATR